MHVRDLKARARGWWSFNTFIYSILLSHEERREKRGVPQKASYKIKVDRTHPCQVTIPHPVTIHDSRLSSPKSSP